MLQWHKMLRIGVRKISEMSPSILSQQIGTISGPNPIKPALSQIHLQKAVTAQPEWRLAEQPGRSNLGQHQHQNISEASKSFLAQQKPGALLHSGKQCGVEAP